MQADDRHHNAGMVLITFGRRLSKDHHVPYGLTKLMWFCLRSLEPRLNRDMPFGTPLNDLVSHSLGILSSQEPF